MHLLKNIDKYLMDTNYKIIIKENIINIINYDEIKDFSNTKVIITTQKNKVTIEGEDLVVSKMQDDEVLIIGKIKTIKL